MQSTRFTFVPLLLFNVWMSFKCMLVETRSTIPDRSIFDRKEGESSGSDPKSYDSQFVDSNHFAVGRQKLLRLRIERRILDQTIAEHAKMLPNQGRLHRTLQTALDGWLKLRHDVICQIGQMLSAAIGEDAVHKTHLPLERSDRAYTKRSDSRDGSGNHSKLPARRCSVGHLDIDVLQGFAVLLNKISVLQGSLPINRTNTRQTSNSFT